MTNWIDDGPSTPKPAKKGGGGSLFDKIKGAAGNVAGDVGGFAEDQGGRVVRTAAGDLKGALNVLAAPGNAVRSAYSDEAQSAARGENPLQAAGHWWSGAGKGLIGKEHTSFAQLVGSVQTGKPVAAKLPWGVETLGEVATDPTTYLGVGAARTAEEGLNVLRNAGAQDVASNIVKQGLKKAGAEDTLRKALVDAGKNPDQVERIVKGVSNSGQGGIKFMGHTIGGLGSESAAGAGAEAVKAAAGRAVAKALPTHFLLDVFRRGGNLAAEGAGKAAADEGVGILDEAAHAANAKNVILQKQFENTLKAHGPLSEEDRAFMADALEGGAKNATEEAAPAVTSFPTPEQTGMATLLKERAAQAALGAEPKEPLSYTQQMIQKAHNSGRSTLGDLLDFADQIRHNTTIAQQEQGLLPFDHVTDKYLPHLETPEFRAWRAKNAAKVDQILGTQGMAPSDLERTLGQQGMTKARTLEGSIDSINRQMNAAGFEGKALEDNPINLTMARAKVANNAVEHAKALDKLTQVMGADGKPLLTKLGTSDALPSGAEDLALPEIGRRYAGSPEMVKMLKESQRIVTDPARFAPVVKGLQTLNKVFKQYAIASPAFHSRKILGDYWMSTLAGIRNPTEIIHGFGMAHTIGKALDLVDHGTTFEDALKAAAPGLSDAERDDINYFFRHGGTSNFVNNEVKGAGAKATDGLAKRVLNKAVKPNQDATAFVSNGFRASVYKHVLEETGSREMAMKAVNKFLFDYGALTPAEKALRGSAVPFYTFMRKNIPLQLEQAWKQPALYNTLAAATNEAQQHGVGYLPKDPVSEAQDFLDQAGSGTLKGTAGAVMSPVSPFVKALPETALGVDDFGNKVHGSAWGNAAHQFLPPFQKVDSFRNKPILQSLLGFRKLKAATQGAPAKAGAPSADWLSKL